MRYILTLALVSVFYSSCKKDIKSCKDYQELKGRGQSADLSVITAQEIKDTLAKYPQLVPYLVRNDQYSTGVSCHVYYKDLLIFTDEYYLYKYTDWRDTVTGYGKILNKDPGISIEPQISAMDAIKQAKKSVNFDHTCITYRLGLYNMNPRSETIPANYRLVWKIMDSQKSYIYVITDAVSNQVIIADDGNRWIE
jgi:hypothetical protein